MLIVALLAGGAMGAAVAWILHLPLWALAGSLVGAGVVAMSFGPVGSLPQGWGLLAQLILGTALGSEMSRGSFAPLREIWLPTLAAICTLIGVGMALGLVLARVSGLESITSLYGLAPGGISEMVAAAEAVGANAPLVAAMHLVRMLAVVSLFVVLARIWARDDGG